MLKLKSVLNDLVDYAYKDDPRLPYYKRFYVEYLKKKLKSKNGDYDPSTHKMRIFTKDRPEISIMKTSIHELAHHIRYAQGVGHGSTAHDKDFYEVYRKLLYAALDMQIFNREAYRSCFKDSTDAKKVQKILDAYVPPLKKTDYKKDIWRIRVQKAFQIKDLLKARGYMFNSYDKVWEKELKKEDIEKERAYLKGIGADFSVEEALRLTF